MGKYEEALMYQEQLLTIRQKTGESCQHFYQRVKQLAQKCEDFITDVMTNFGLRCIRGHGMGELAIISFWLGLEERIKRYMWMPHQYDTLEDAYKHVKQVELYLKGTERKLATITEEVETSINE